MKKIIILCLFLAATLVVAGITAGIEFPVNMNLLKLVLGTRLNGYTAAICLSIILASLPHLISKFFNKKKYHRFGYGLLLIALGVFSILGYVLHVFGTGFFPLILVLLLFGFNIILCSFYYRLKDEYRDDIKIYLLRRLIPKLKNTLFLYSQRLLDDEEIAQNQAEDGVRKEMDQTEAKINASSHKKERLARNKDQVLTQIRALIGTIDDDIDGIAQTFNS